MDYTPLAFLTLGIFGVYFITSTPLNKRQNLPKFADLLTGFIFICVCLTYMTVIYLLPEYLSDEADTNACGPKSVQAYCYSLDLPACKGAWESSRAECEAAAAPTRQKRPGAILSPIIYRCQAKKFDRALSYNRKNEDSDTCKEYFRKMSR